MKTSADEYSGHLWTGIQSFGRKKNNLTKKLGIQIFEWPIRASYFQVSRRSSYLFSALNCGGKLNFVKKGLLQIMQNSSLKIRKYSAARLSQAEERDFFSGGLELFSLAKKLFENGKLHRAWNSDGWKERNSDLAERDKPSRFFLSEISKSKLSPTEGDKWHK